MRASASRPAETAPRVPSIQLPFLTPSHSVSMSWAIHTPDHGSTGAFEAVATSGLAVLIACSGSGSRPARRSRHSRWL